MKAIIPAAGLGTRFLPVTRVVLGTRFLPVTRVVPKEMLPIGAKPALELIVDEARAAGAGEIVIVISEGKDLIRKYFEGQGDIRFVYQKEQKGLGHAVLQAEIDDDALILLGDALVVGCCAAREMVEVSKRHAGAAVIGCERVPKEKVSRYGIMKLEGDRIVPAAIFGYLKTQTPGKGGEIQLTDAIKRMLSERDAYAYVYPGKRQDIGNPDGYFAALEAYRGNS